ncbi:MAG: hypothetical protein AB7N76_03210 [Planctomycetota bacterium]
MSRAAALALVLGPALILALPPAGSAARADDGKQPPAKPAPEPGPKPAPKPGPEPGPKQPAAKPGQDGKPGQDAKPKKAPDLVPPTPELAKLLARYDREAEPGRELKRAFLSVLHYLFRRDVKRAIAYFHPDLRVHTGSGDLAALPLEELEALFQRQRDEPPPGEGKPLAELALLETLTVLSQERIAAAKKDEELAKEFRIDPRRLLPHLRAGDWLALVRFRKAEGVPPEVFYVFRRHGERFKVVLAE